MRAQFVYVADAPNNVSAYSIDRKTGAMTPVPGSAFATGRLPTSVAVDLTGRFVYVANGGVPGQAAGTVWGYSIDDKTGALTSVPGSPFAAGAFPVSVAVDSAFVYVTNFPNNTVWGYRIDRKTGALTPVPGSPFPTGAFPNSVAVDPTAQFAYVANQLAFNVSAYSIDRKTGALTPVPASPFPTQHPSSVAVDSAFVYVTNSGGSNAVSGYSIDRKTGALTPVPGSPFPTQNPVSVAVDSAFVYVTNSGGSNTVSGYSIDRKTGALTPVSGSPFPTGAFPISVAVDSTARFAYVANGNFLEQAGTVSGYSINDKTGALTPVPGSPFATVAFPQSIAISRH